MPGFPLLDLAIGMAFVYLLLSLICSSLSEGVESFARYRAKDLEEGVRLLLSEPRITHWFRHLLRHFSRKSRLEDGTLTAALYRHPMIRCLYRSEDSLPTYIPSRNFAIALMDLLKSSGALIENAAGAVPGGKSGALDPDSAIQSSVENVAVPKDLKAAMVTIIRAANQDTVRIREGVESWFNSTMDRASGWYKRRVQFILFGIAILVTVVANADTISILKRMIRTKNLSAIVASAADFSGNSGRPSQQRLADLQRAASELESLDLGIGWNIPSASNTTPQTGPRNGAGNAIPIESAAPVWLSESRLTWPQKLFGYLSWCGALIWMHAAGWIITSAAIALGAPFWFDTLNRFIVVRSTVKPKEKSPEEPSKA